MVNLGNDWDKVLEGEFDKEYYLKLREFITTEYSDDPDIYCSGEDCKVILLTDIDNNVMKVKTIEGMRTDES